VIVAETAMPRAFAVWWKDLDRWSANSFHLASWQWPSTDIKALSSALERRCEPVDKDSFELESEHLVSLRFTGEIEPRDLHGKEDFKGKLFYARAGDIIYSKIDVRNGAIGIIPPTLPIATVTSEFPVYRIKKDVAIPEYIQLVFRTAHFRSIINGMVSGTSGRKRVQPADLERVKIPIPSSSEQEAILLPWRRAQKLVEQAQAELSASSQRLDLALHEISNSQSLETQMLTLSWSNLEPWDVKSARAAAFRLANPTFLPLSEYAEEATEMVKPWEEPEKEWPVYGVNNKDGVFFSHKQKGDEFNAPYKRIRKNWFFHNPTRSSVGSLGIVPEVPEDAITSPEYQVWRVRPEGEWEPEFVAALVRTTWFVKLIQVHRVGAVKQRLYVENLLSMPMPPVPQNIRNEAAKQRLAALLKVANSRRASKAANDLVEALVLGIKKVSEL
jgi:hypothetical protein